MIEIRPFDLSGSPLRNGEEFFNAGFSLAALNALVAFSQGFRNGARHSFPCRLGDGRREAMRFRVFDVQTQG